MLLKVIAFATCSIIVSSLPTSNDHHDQQDDHHYKHDEHHVNNHFDDYYNEDEFDYDDHQDYFKHDKLHNHDLHLDTHHHIHHDNHHDDNGYHHDDHDHHKKHRNEYYPSYASHYGGFKLMDHFEPLDIDYHPLYDFKTGVNGPHSYHIKWEEGHYKIVQPDGRVRIIRYKNDKNYKGHEDSYLDPSHISYNKYY